MTLVRFFFTVVIFGIFLDKDHGNCDPASCIEKASCYSQKSVARAQIWHQAAQSKTSEPSFANAQFAPLARPFVLAAHPGRNGASCDQWLAMWHLPQNEIPTGMVLRHLRAELGDLCDADGEPKREEGQCKESMDPVLDGSIKCREIEEPQTQNEASIPKEAAVLASGRTSRWSRSFSLATSSRLAAECFAAGCKRFQGLWQRIQSHAGTDGTTPSATSANVDWTWATHRTTMDAQQSCGNATNSCHDAVSGHHIPGTATYADNADCSTIRRATDWSESPTEVEQNCQSREERRESLCKNVHGIYIRLLRPWTKPKKPS